MSSIPSVGEWLRHQRRERGLTQEMIADKIGCSLITLRKIEAGERRPSRQIAILLAGYFGVPTGEHEMFISFARTGRLGAVAAPSTSISGDPFSSQDAPWRAAQHRRTNLPTMLTSLVGREAVEAELCGILLQPRVRLLTLTGPPGVGKTRLALQVAADMLEHFEDGAFFVELAPIGDPELVVPAIARALGLNETEGRPLEKSVHEHVRDKHILLLLDNFEQVLDAAPSLIELVQISPRMKVLVTSREALHVRGERRFSLPPLGLPDPESIEDLYAVSSNPAVELCVERTQAIRPDFTLTLNNVADVAGICISLDGLPLAIELAATRIAILPPHEVRAALDSRLKLLTLGSRDLPARQRTLRAALEWSYDLLSTQEQSVFRRLAIFVGGFTLEAAEGVYKPVAESKEATNMLDVVSSLLNKSLLQQRDGVDGETRFAMLETIREYALMQLRTAGEQEEVERQRALFFVGLAEEALPHLKEPDQLLWLERLEKEHDNIQATLDWAIERDPELALKGIVVLGMFWHLRGHRTEATEWQAKALAKSATAPANLRAKVFTEAGWNANAQGDTDQAQLLLEEALDLCRQTGDAASISQALSYLGFVLSGKGDYRRARALLEECMALDTKLGNKQGISWTANALGELARLEGDYEQAHVCYARGLALAMDTGDKYKIAISTINLGWAMTGIGDYAQAGTFLRDGLRLMSELKDKAGITWCLAGLAGLQAAQGRQVMAAHLAGAVENLLQDIGSPLDAADSADYMRHQARVRAELGEDLFGKAHAEGQAMTQDEVVKYVLLDDAD